MRRVRWILAALLVPALMLSWSAIAFAQDYGDATPSPGASEGNQPSVFVRQDPVLGAILTDAKGMTLYMWANDTTKGETTCYDKCAQNWPPYSASEPFSLPFTVKGEITSVQRTDGASQIAFNGIPLYTFVKDTEPGQTNGQGVGDVWFVVHPDAQFGQTAAAEATPTTAMTAGTPAAAGTVDVTLIDGVISASATTFTVGQKYTFNVANNGTIQHEFYIEKAGAVDQPLKTDSGEEAEIKRFDPGQTMTLDFTFTEPGIYQFACHVPGHYPAGMALTIMVVQ